MLIVYKSPFKSLTCSLLFCLFLEKDYHLRKSDLYHSLKSSHYEKCPMNAKKEYLFIQSRRVLAGMLYFILDLLMLWPFIISFKACCKVSSVYCLYLLTGVFDKRLRSIFGLVVVLVALTASKRRFKRMVTLE